MTYEKAAPLKAFPPVRNLSSVIRRGLTESVRQGLHDEQEDRRGSGLELYEGETASL